MKVVALGTGTSCLGFNQVSKNGKLVHDCHAEIIARRSFNRYLFDQCNKIAEVDCIFKINHLSKKFQLKDGICFHFYSSQSPCGDASIYQIENLRRTSLKRKSGESVLLEIKRSKGIEEESIALHSTSSHIDIHRTGAKCAPGEKRDKYSSGTSYHEVGPLRTKPGRGFPTRSMSCSDKMMKWNIMGCQGALVSWFLHKPIYLASFTTPRDGQSLYALERALFERVPIHALTSLLEKTIYSFNQPQIFGTEMQFRFSNSQLDSLVPCGSSISWCDVSENSYDVIAKNGLRLGIIKKHQNLPKAVSSVSRLELFRTFKNLLKKFSRDNILQVDLLVQCNKYEHFKNCIDYSKVWSNVHHKLFPHWSQHDRSLDSFTL